MNLQNLCGFSLQADSDIPTNEWRLYWVGIKLTCSTDPQSRYLNLTITQNFEQISTGTKYLCVLGLLQQLQLLFGLDDFLASQ